MTLLDMENKESILSALNDLEPDGKPPAILEEYIREIARHGLTFIPWVHIKPLILLKFNHIMDEFIEDIDENVNQKVLRSTDINDLRERVYKILSQFEGTPFTVQRICELLTDPRKYYTRPDKFLRGFEKVCLVVSTVDAYGNKIHNVEPRLSGTIERCTAVVFNGSSSDSGPSGEESPSEPKCSDGEEEDSDEITTRRPCINFYRRPPSKLVEGLQKSFSDGLIGAYSPGIPGKHTLQRPFLSGRSSISFNTIFEDAENSAVVEADDDDNDSDEGEGKQRKQANESCAAEGDSEHTETSRIGQAPKSQSSQPTHPLTGMQKLFLETEVEETAKHTTPVPPIDQMLRPMGQLEAFVNTISRVSATPLVGSAASASTSITSTANEMINEESSSVDVKIGSGVSKVDGKQKGEEFDIPITEIQPPEDITKETAKEQKGGAPLKNSEGTLLSRTFRASLKRDSEVDDNMITLVAPAKKIRFDADDMDRSEMDNEFINVDFSEATPIAMDYADSYENVKQSTGKSPTGDSIQVQLLSGSAPETSASKDDFPEEAEVSTTIETQGQVENEKQPHMTVKSDIDEINLLK